VGFPSFAAFLNAVVTVGRERRQFWHKVMTNTLSVGTFWSFWRVAGAGSIPPAGTDPAGLTARQILFSTIVGGMNLGLPGPSRSTHLSRFSVIGNNINARGTFMVMDRLLDYGEIDHNSIAVQALANPVGLPRYTTGDGVMAFLEAKTTFSAGTATLTLTYTNELGVGGRVATTTILSATPLNRIPHNPMFLNLQAGDLGVRSVQSVQFTIANVLGRSNLVLVKPMYALPMTTVNTLYERDMVIQAAALERLFDDHSLMLALASSFAGTNPTFRGEIHSVEN
jgi:hypothetical protein